MKFFFSPGSCALATHIVLEELKLNYEAKRVDLKTHTVDGQDYYKINSAGAVPALILDDGNLLTQSGAILIYLAEQNPQAKLLPVAGTFERSQCLQWLFYLISDVHKAYVPLFKPHHFVSDASAQQQLHDHTLKTVHQHLEKINHHLANSNYILKEFSIVDAYLYIFKGWMQYFKINLDAYPNYQVFCQRMEQRSAVQSALKAEGLI